MTEPTTGTMPTDMRGVRIKLGSHIVYPARRGSDMWMNEAVVESYHQGDDTQPYLYVQVLREKGKHVETPRWVRISNLKNVAVVG